MKKDLSQKELYVKIRKYSSVFSFFLTAACLIVILFCQNILGRNNMSIVRSDLFAQYIPYINNFLSVLKGETSLWYSFSNYLGSGNILNIAYYSINPFNMIFLIDGINIGTLLTILIIAKISLSSAFFQLFCKKNISENIFCILLSCFYGLSGFALITYYNIMWLDALYMLPILVHLIIRYIKDGKFLCLIAAYAYIFITNFYMAYITGVFTAVFFVVYLLYFKQYKLKGCIKYYARKGFGYAFCIVLAAGMCAIVLLSTVGFLYSHIATDNNAFVPLQESLLEIFNTMYIGELASSNNVVPYLYCGIPVLGLIILYFVCDKTPLLEKVSAAILVVFYIVGMINVPIYSFLHAFDYPNFNAFRFAYVLVFVFVSLACIMVNRLDKAYFSFLKKLSVFLVVFYSFMTRMPQVQGKPSISNTQAGLIINATFICLWLIVFYICIVIKEDHENKRKITYFFIFLVGVSELLVNGNMLFKQMDLTNMGDAEFNEWYYAEKEAINKIKEDESFYRVYVENEWCYNAASYFNYNSLNTFSSSDNYELRKALSHLGVSTSNREIEVHTLLPVFDSLFAVKYRIDMPEYELWENKPIDEENFYKASVSCNDRVLSLGYMVSDNILSYQFETNSFNNIENLANAMVGKNEDIYTSYGTIDIDTINMDYFYDDSALIFYKVAEEAKEGYVLITSPDAGENSYAEIYMKDPGAYGASPLVYGEENGILTHTYLTSGGAYKCSDADGDRGIVISSSEDQAFQYRIDGVYFAEYNEGSFDDIYDELSKNQFMIEENTGDFISGSVVATSNKNLLFTSIPYDPEWVVLVDGVPSSIYRVVGDAFIAVPLEEGIHNVSFVYIEKYSMIGAILSFVSVIVYCLLVLISLFSLFKKK